MSARASNWAYEQRLAPTLKAILVALAYRHNAASGQCNPSVETLAAMTGLSARAVQYGLRELEAAGLIAATEGKAGGRARSTNWRFTILKGARDAPFIRPERVQETAGFRKVRKGAPGAPDIESLRGEGGAGGQRRSAMKGRTGGEDPAPSVPLRLVAGGKP